MDDILLCAEAQIILDVAVQDVITMVQEKVFEIAEDKVQKTAPWKYLGLKIAERTITPQTLQIKDNPKTLPELYQLCRSIKWKRSLLGITTEDLAQLFLLLKGSEEFNSPRSLSPEAKAVVQKIARVIQIKQEQRFHPNLPFSLAILGVSPKFHALLFHSDLTISDPLIIIEGDFRSH